MEEAPPMLILLFSPSLDITSRVMLIGGTTWTWSSHSLCETPHAEPQGEAVPGEDPGGSQSSCRQSVRPPTSDTEAATLGMLSLLGKGVLRTDE